MDDKAAKILRNLQKLPANKRCFNCESLGPGYVVPQFNVFVCTDCSGIHMHTGHRVKSIAMAKFTPEEVKRLQEGGNEITAKSYLARWKPETDTQKPVDRNPKRVQQWIKVVFTDRAYFSEVAPAPAPVEVVSKLEEPPKLVSPTTAPLSRTSPPAPTTPPAQHETSLMDFGSEPVPASEKAAAPAAAAAAADPFDPFAISAPSSAAPASASASAFDPFGNSHAAPANPPPSTAATPTTSFDPFSTSHVTPGAASPAPPAASSGFGSGFDPFNNTASAPWPSATPAATAPIASDWTSFDTSTAFPAVVSAPVAFTQVAMSHPLSSGPHSGFPSAASTPTASAAMDAFGQHAFGGPTGFGPPAFHPPAFHPPPQGGFGTSQFPVAGTSDAGFGMPPFSGAASSAPTTPTSAAEKAAAAARNELPSDLFAEPAFPAHAAPYGMPQPAPQMGYMQVHTGGMPAYPPQHAAGFGHAGMPMPHMQQQQQQQQHMFANPGQAFAAPGQYAAGPPGFPQGQGMPGFHPQAPGVTGGYTMQTTGGSAYPGMQAAPAPYQQPGAHAAFFRQGGASFTGQQALQGFGGMPGNPYEAPANGFSQQAPAAPPAALGTGGPPKKPEDLAFADLVDLKKALPKSAGPSTPSYSSGGGFGGAAASSGNPFA